MQKSLSFVMNLRTRTKDVGLALLKLDKLPLQSLRKAGKSTVGGSRDSNSEDASCDKCKRIIDKSFTVEREHVTRVSTDNNESRKDKLETIVEHPLVEAEPRIEGMDAIPKLLGNERFKQPMDRRRQKNFDLDTMKGLDELACKLMKVPASQIDAKLLDACLSARAVNFEQKARTYPIVEDFDSGGVPQYVRHFEESFGDDSDSPVYVDSHTNLTPMCYRSYNLNLESDSYETSFRAEKSYPSHLDVEFVMSVHKDPTTGLYLRASEPIRYGILSYNMMLPPPLPANETSISSRMKHEEELQGNMTRDRTMPSYMREGKKAEDPTAAHNSVEEICHNYLSTLTSGSATLDHTMDQPKVITIDRKKQEIPLSQLLKQVRQKNRIAQEMQKKKFKFDPGRFWSKSTCLPPLDLRPKSATCSPKACPPRRKETPPQKAMPCPPPKKSSCPPPAKKGPCPVKANPCDPCKPPPPCPAKKSPCGFYTGNKFKDTITLILCGCNPSIILRQAIGLPLLCNYSHSLVQGIVKNISTTAASYAALKLKSVKDLEVERDREEVRDVYFARSFDPWAPIPSWPEPKKAEKKKLVCPKEGCKMPKVEPTKPPCKEFPCSFNAADRKR